jgi:CheY-like chemotaxis protein
MTKTHWMGDVLKEFAPTLGELAQTTAPIQVWQTARAASGLSIGQLTKKVAAHFKLEVADLGAADLRILKLVPEKLARRYTVFPIHQTDRHLYVATSEPGNIAAEQAIGFASSRSTVFQIAPPQLILDAIDRQYSPHYIQPIEMDNNAYLQITEPVSLPAQKGIEPGAESAAEPAAGPAAASTPAIQPTPPLPVQGNSVWGDVEHDISAAAMNYPHVLIVDDDPGTRRLAWSILAKQGYRVMEASDGIEALERVAEGTPLALIVLDLDMPRLGGRDVLAKLRSSAPTLKIPVIVLTASSDDADEAALMEQGADDYIRKPIEPTRFTARIKGVLRRAKG